MSSRLRAPRVVDRIRILCLVAAGVALFVAAPMQAGSTRAAEGKIRVELRGKYIGPNGQKGNSGRFVLTGALSDRGRYVTRPGFSATRTLYGAKGTIRIAIPQGARRLPSGKWQNDWEIVGGTKSYAGFRGSGTEAGFPPPRSAPHRMRMTMTGTVFRLDK